MSAEQLLQQARRQAEGGDHAAAEASLRRVVERDPGCVEACVGLAHYAGGGGRAEEAADWWQRAVALAPENAESRKELGLARVALGDHEGAERELAEAVRLRNDFPMAWLNLGQLREARGDATAALTAYYRAITKAQAKGRWRSRETTPPAWHAVVLHAMDVIEHGRRDLFYGQLEEAEAQHGAPLPRIRRTIAGYLKDEAIAPPDRRQAPRFLYVPDLPSRTYYDKASIGFSDRLEAAFADLRGEALGLLAQPEVLTPFLEFKPGDDPSRYLGGADAAPHWDAFFFYRNGVRYDTNHARSPLSSALLESLPLVRIREHAPEICFSVLTAGSHILAHTGVTNSRLVVHLPLLVPPDCAIRVGGEDHAWREGEVVVFDDSFEHEAWNRSDRTRVILLMDTWHPELAPAERVALGRFIETIGDLERGWP